MDSIKVGPQNYDLKSTSDLIGTSVSANATALGAGAVPTGMKRYVTYVRAVNLANQENTLYIASAAGSATTTTPTLASAAQKYSTRLEVAQTQEFPMNGPDPIRPLFSLAAGSFINLLTDKGNIRLFMQFYDQ